MRAQICNITCWGWPNYERHCASRKHLRRAIAAAAATEPGPGGAAAVAAAAFGGGPELPAEQLAGAFGLQAEPHRPCNQARPAALRLPQSCRGRLFSSKCLNCNGSELRTELPQQVPAALHGSSACF